MKWVDVQRFLKFLLFTVLISSTAWADEPSLFEAEASPRAAKNLRLKYETLERQGVDVPLRWRSLDAIVELTPAPILFLARMGSPLDKRLLPEGLELDSFEKSIKTPSAQEIREIFHYVTRAELYEDYSPLTQKRFIEHVRALEMHQNESYWTAIDLPYNIIRGLNLLEIFEARNPNSEPLELQALLEILKLNSTAESLHTRILSLDESFYKKTLQKLMGLKNSADLQKAFQTVTEFPVATQLRLFQSDTTLLRRDYQKSIFVDQRLALSYILEILGKKSNLQLPAQEIYTLSRNFIRHLHEQATAASAVGMKKSMLLEIIDIAARTQFILAPLNSFASKSMAGESLRIQNELEALNQAEDSRQEQQLRDTNIQNQKQSISQQQEKVRTQIRRFLQTNSIKSPSLELGALTFQAHKKDVFLGGEKRNLIEVTYFSENESASTAARYASDISRGRTDFASALFIFTELIQQPYHDGIIWNAPLPAEISSQDVQQLRSLKERIYKMTSVALCKAYFH